MNRTATHGPRTRPAIQRPATRATRRLTSGAPLLLWAGMCLVITVVEPSFVSPRSLQSLALETSPILILAVGQTVVILLGGIDLSLAALASLASVLLAVLLPPWGIVGLLVVVVATTLIGALQGAIHAYAQAPSFVVTLGGLGVFSGLALVISGEANQPVGQAGRQLLSWADPSTVAGVPRPFVVALGLVAVVSVVMRRTQLGRWVRAIGHSEPAALTSGVNRQLVRVGAFALVGLCSALAAVVLTARTGYASPSLADGLLLPTIAAVVAGGTAISGGVGGLSRTVMGALIVTTIRAGTVAIGVDPVLQNVVFGITIIIAVAATTDRKKLLIVK